MSFLNTCLIVRAVSRGSDLINCSCKTKAFQFLHTYADNAWQLRLTRHLADDILKSKFLNIFLLILSKFNWNFFLSVQLTTCQHWFRYWHGAKHETSHYLNQCWPNLLMYICTTRPQWVKTMTHGKNGCHSADDIFQQMHLHSISL